VKSSPSLSPMMVARMPAAGRMDGSEIRRYRGLPIRHGTGQLRDKRPFDTFQLEPANRGLFGKLASFLRRVTCARGENALLCQIRSFEACPMKHQHHFETTAAQQTTPARALIVDVYRTIQVLNIATTAEQDRAEVCDRERCVCNGVYRPVATLGGTL
jgi:hypothetical protein